MKKQSGFTVIELLVIIAFLLTASVITFMQIDHFQSEANNRTKKTAINAIYYSLEEYFYNKNQYYPENLTDKTLPTMDKTLLTDPSGKKLGEPGSSYRYEPTNCENGKCKAYQLRTSLTKEADFIKHSRHK